MMASTRATCKLDSDALAEVLKKFVTKTEWLLMPARYESPKTKRARIMNMAGVARAIVKVAENLNLQKKQAEKAVSLAFKKNQVNCDADAEGIKDAKLIRHNLRFIQQARSKSQGSDTWVEGLFRERVLWKAFVKAGTSVDARKRQEPEPEVDGGHESADLFSGGEEGKRRRARTLMTLMTERMTRSRQLCRRRSLRSLRRSRTARARRQRLQRTNGSMDGRLHSRAHGAQRS